MPVGDETFTPELAAAICQRLAEGETLREICRSEGMPSKTTVLKWANEDIHGFGDQYTRAREIGWLDIADEIIEISDDGQNDWMERNDPENPGWVANGENIQRSRLRVDSRKWMLSKMLPKIYGDRTHATVEATIKPAKPLSDEAAIAEIAELSQALGLKYQLVEVVDEEEEGE